MISLYVHLPFCQSKCKYCAFVSFPLSEQGAYLDPYLASLKAEIRYYAQYFSHEKVKTLYFWGGTPNLLWKERLSELIEEIQTCFDCSELVELSFEFNPYPEEEIYEIVRSLQHQYGKKYPRIRFSFGIQSFDNEVLHLAGRKSSFLGLVDFLRALQPLKQDTTVFNFDFIAFWKWNHSKKGQSYLWTPSALQFFIRFVESYFADSFSLYTLELFENQFRKKKNPDTLISGAYFWTDEQIYEEFSLLKQILLDAGYHRYELSNFSLPGKSSIHNRTYWEMESYLGLGLHASSFFTAKQLTPEFCSHLWIQNDKRGIRLKNTATLAEYLNHQWLDEAETQFLTDKDYLIEAFFLGLRTDRGISSLSSFEEVLVSDYTTKLQHYEKLGFLSWIWDTLVLKDQGMDVFNSLVVDLLREI